MNFTIKLFILFILCGCSKKITQTHQRTVYINHGNQPKFEDFSFTYKENDNSKVYSYRSINDTLKYIEIVKINDVLVFGHNEFKRLENKQILYNNIDNQSFNFYYSKYPGEDETGPLMFSDNYGLLGIYNVFGPNLIFLNTKNKELAKEIETELGNFKYP